MSKVLILGGDSDRNVGDAAILAALCHTLRAVDDSVRITITASEPRATRLPGVVEVLPRGTAGALPQLAAAARSDLVLVGGGGLFQDDDSRVKMPFWASRLAALRTRTDNIAGLSLGVGPLQHVESRALARLACATMRQVSVRDPFAARWLEQSLGRPVQIVPDPAFMLEPAAPERAQAALREAGVPQGRKLIGVALRRWFHARGGFVPHRWRVRAGLDRDTGHAQMQRFEADLAMALRALARELDAVVLFMPSYAASHEGDAAVCARVAAQLDDVASHTFVSADPSLYKAVTGCLQLLVAARMHPTILASAMGVPVIGLAYNGKFAGAFELLGIANRLVWLEEFRERAQASRLQALALDALHDGERLAKRAAVLAATTRAAVGSLLARRA